MEPRTRDPPIDHLRGKNADHNGELVDRHQQPAFAGGSDFRDIHRRDVRSEADAHTAEDAPEHKPLKGTGASDAQRGNREIHRGGNQDGLASEAVAERPGYQGPSQTAEQRTTLSPPDRRCGIGHQLLPERGVNRHARRRVGEVKKRFVKFCGPADDHPIVTEEQSAERSHQSDPPDIGGVDAFFSARWLRSLASRNDDRHVSSQLLSESRRQRHGISTHKHGRSSYLANSATSSGFPETHHEDFPGLLHLVIGPPAIVVQAPRQPVARNPCVTLPGDPKSPKRAGLCCRAGQ